MTDAPMSREGLRAPQVRPYFECTPEQWTKYTDGMSESGVRKLANMLAHGCLLCRREESGWIITRFDLIRDGKPFWHVSNDGVLTYNYQIGALASPPAAVGRDAVGPQAFKAFHKMLCERFNYPHDESYWWRDQVSLMEHVAALAPRPEADDAREVEAIIRREVKYITNGCDDLKSGNESLVDRLTAALTTRPSAAPEPSGGEEAA